jgi:hypothetical protein
MKQDNQTSDVSADLSELLEVIGESPKAPPTLAQLKKEAHGLGKRRADRIGSRDNLIYRAGYALDSVMGLEIPPDEFAGMLSWPAPAFKLFKNLGCPDELSVIKLMSIVLTQPEVSEWARAEGRYLQWERLALLRKQETDAFKASAAFANPERWRPKSPKREQMHIIAEICRLTDTPRPDIKTRGEAFDFIDQANGNPRFWVAPIRLPKPKNWA